MAFIYVGRLDELKGIKVLFEAWKIMEEGAPELIVCGTGPLEGWCKEYIKDNRLTGIKMFGKVDNATTKRLIAESDALILPSLWYEGFPMVIAEAYSVGTLAIGSNIGNVGCLVQYNSDGQIFKAGDPAELKGIVSSFKIRHTSNVRYHCYIDSLSAETNYSLLMSIYGKVK